MKALICKIPQEFNFCGIRTVEGTAIYNSHSHMVPWKKIVKIRDLKKNKKKENGQRKESSTKILRKKKQKQKKNKQTKKKKRQFLTGTAVNYASVTFDVAGFKVISRSFNAFPEFSNLNFKHLCANAVVRLFNNSRVKWN